MIESNTPNPRALARRLASFVGTLAFVITVPSSPHTSALAETVRFATYNVSLNRCANGINNPCLDGGLQSALASPNFRPARQIAETLQRLRPDVVLLNEFNYDSAGTSAGLFQDKYLSVGQNESRSETSAEPIEYPFRYLAPSNTGIASGHDLNNDGQVGADPGNGVYANDAYGFGEFPGRYGMLLLSRFPIETDLVRSFQDFRWKDMPGALLPDDLNTPEANDWYDAAELAEFRLSSKSHWDVPIQLGDQTIHVLASHPTPPVFDGAEDRNGRRNHDEIRLWSDYISSKENDYLYDDAGRLGGLPEDASFVILGDLNADPDQGDSFDGAIQQLLEHERVNSSMPPTNFNGGTNTATFDLRVDYVLPSTDLDLVDTAIFEPEPRDPLRRLVGASDHRLVWADINVATVPEPAGGGFMVGSALLAILRRRRGSCAT